MGKEIGPPSPRLLIFDGDTEGRLSTSEITLHVEVKCVSASASGFFKATANKIRIMVFVVCSGEKNCKMSSIQNLGVPAVILLVQVSPLADKVLQDLLVKGFSAISQVAT